MITWHFIKISGTDKQYVEGDCLSSDIKPTTGILNGSVLFEMDTSTLYKYDEANEQWRAWS